MDVLEIFKLSWVALRANKIRSFLTMLGIIIGVMSVILLISLGNGLQNYITQQFEGLGTNVLYIMPGQVIQEGQSFSGGMPNFAGSKLTLKDTRDASRLGRPIIDASASIEQPIAIKYQDISKYIRVHGVTENMISMISIKVILGREISKGDMDRSKKVVVLGYNLQEKFFGEQNPLGKMLLIGDFRFEVIGVTEKKGGGLGATFDDICFIPLTSAQRLFNQENVQAIEVEVDSKENISEAKKILEQHFLKKYKEDEFSVVDQASLISTINSIIGVLTAALGGIAAISLLVGGIGIMNIMLVSVTERTREIGLRKAVGAKSQDILWQFLIEAVNLCLAGGSVGVVLGVGGSLLAQKFIPASVPLWAVLLAFGFSAAVGIIFGVAPAAKAAKLDPIDALRYE